MNELEFDRIARSWLLEGPTRLADRVVDAALDEVHLTSQRRAFWPARRRTPMPIYLRLAAAAALVVAVGLATWSLLPGGPGQVGPTPSPSPTIGPSPTPEATPTSLRLSPGSSSIVVVMAALDGWVQPDTFVVQKHGGDQPDGMAIAAWLVKNVYREGCQWEGSLYDPQIETSPEALANALAALNDREVTAPVPVTIDGYSGYELEMTIPDLDFATCDEAQFRTWIDPFDGPRFHQGPLEHSRILILDVDTTRLLVFGRSWPGTSPADLAEMNGLLDSMQIESPLAP